MATRKQNVTTYLPTVSRKANESRRAKRKLFVERLESRELMAVTAWRDGATLVINADPAGGQVDFRSAGSTLQVSGPGGVLNLNASGVNEIRFHGSARDDTFTNYTSIDSTIYGNSGNDRLNGGKGVDNIYGGEGNDTITGGNGTRSRVVCRVGLVVGIGIQKYCDTVTYSTQNFLYGGGGDDTIIGGSGGDQIFGESGDDNLYGRDGIDRLDGGSGNDGLYGGSENDLLTGGDGSDRFLRYNRGGTIFDAKWDADVQIIFSDRHLVWQDREVEEVDAAFAQLQRRVNGSTWIFKDTLTDDPLVFTKVRPGDIGTAVGQNRVSWSPFDYDREIKIVDWNEYSGLENRDVRSVVIHEIGHNWDGTSFPFAHESNPYWNGFSALHNASQRSNDFARNYGQTNAKEDWSTVWELYFGYGFGPNLPSSVLREKLALVDAFFDSPSNWLS